MDQSALDQPVAEKADVDDVVLGDADLDSAVLDNAVLDDSILDIAVLDDEVLDDEVLDAPALEENDLDENDLDEAVLDVVALAMAAPDPDGEIDYSGPDPDELIEPVRTAAMAVGMPQPAAPQMQASAFRASPAPEPQSIGSALLANGFLEQHRAPANDPLAPIRRMSQAEKIAFFS